jgi:Flp pilus assembly protein TadD
VRGTPTSASWAEAGRRSLAAGQAWTAIGCYRAALRLRFVDAELHHALGRAYQAAQRHDAAVDCFRRALAMGAEPARMERALADSLARCGTPREAARRYRRRLRAEPGDASAWSGLGLALSQIGKQRWAAACTARATRLAPAWAGVHGNHGVVEYRRHRLGAALASFERASELAPGHPVARYHASLVHLTRGDYARGFADFDAHLQIWAPRFLAQRRTCAPGPGRTIALVAHNGLGDTLQFVRYVPRLAATGARVVLQVQDRLRPLLASLPGVDQMLPPGPLPPCDGAFSLLELPRVFGDTLDTVPRDVPYLCADAGLAEAWRARLGSGFHVGLVWHGNPLQTDGLYRSCPFDELSALGGVPGVRFVSLQMGEGAEELASGANPLGVRDLAGELDGTAGPFMDTAALLSSLDLVVSVDTSVAHLAGALGRPVFLLLPDWADWRWLRDTDGSPWYPTFRLFRQPRPFDWATPLRAIRAELASLASTRRPGGAP